MNLLRTLLAATALFAATSSWADPRLLGAWTSMNADKGALSGTMEFSAKGEAVLKAKEQPPMTGTWKIVKPGELSLGMGEYGEGAMKYRFIKKQLVVTYDNGNEQTFQKSKVEAVKTVKAVK